jgi:uncharacterized DUF497 family protein
MLKKVMWSEEKNIHLKQSRGVTFEDISTALDTGFLLKTIDNPSTGRAHQGMYIVYTNNYVYAVPFVEDDEKIFLKTLYPCRKYAKEFLTNTL